MKKFFLYLVLSLLTFSCVFAEDGLVSRWTFNECTGGNEVIDSVGNNHGIYSKEFFNCAVGEKLDEQAISFSGVTAPSYVEIPSSLSLSMVDEFTYSVTFRITSSEAMNGLGNTVTVGGAQALLSKAGDRSGIMISLEEGEKNAGKYRIGVGNGQFTDENPGALVQMYTSSVVEIGKWHTIVVTKDNSLVKLYLDGVKQIEMPASEFNLNPEMASRELLFGIGENKYRYPLNGLIDEVSVYNIALNKDEVQEETKKIPPLKIASFNRVQNLKFVPKSNVKEENLGSKKPQEHNPGDPIDLSTGEFSYNNTLFSIPGNNIPYEFNVSYKSQLYYDGPIGNNWTYSYNEYLIEEENGDISYYDGDFNLYKFPKNGDNYEYNFGLKANLQKTSDGYILTFDSGAKYYFNDSFDFMTKLSKVEDRNGNNLTFTYDEDGFLIETTDTIGRKIEYTYYEHDRLEKIVDFNGNKAEFFYYADEENNGSEYDLKEIKLTNNGEIKTISFEYTTNGDNITAHNLTKLRDSKGQLYVENIYDDEDRVKSQKYGDGTLTYTYGNSLTSVVDKEGNKTDYSYDENGLTTQIVYYRGAEAITYKYTYDENYLLTSETRPNGNGVVYSYDNKGNVIERRIKENMLVSNSSEDIVTNYTYNNRNQILTQTDSNNNIVTNTYDSNGNLMKREINGNGNVTSENYNYNVNGLLKSITDTRGNKINLTYENGLLTKIEMDSLANNENTIETFSYNDYGFLTSLIDSNGNISSIELSEFNQILKYTDSKGISLEALYDKNNNKTKEIIKDKNGKVLKETNYTYDILDRVVEIKEIYELENITKTTKLVYDKNGNITEIHTSGEASVYYIYDILGNITEEKIGDIVSKFSYDKNGNLTSVTDDLGNTTSYVYDNFDRLISVKDTAGNGQNYTYDKVGNVTSKTDKNGTKTDYVYDDFGRLLSVSQGNVVLETYEYNAFGDLIKAIDGNGNPINYEYDSLGRQTGINYVDGMNTIFGYDKNNNLTKIINPNGTIVNNIYDNLNRLTDRNITLGEDVLGPTNEVYEYDELGRLVKSRDNFGTEVRFEYDTLNRIISETNGAETIKYSYDDNNNLISKLTPLGRYQYYTYDNLNRLTNVSSTPNPQPLPPSQGGSGGEIVIANYTYNSILLKSQKLGNGLINSYTYDNLYRLTELNTATKRFTYSYDLDNNITNIIAVNPKNKTNTTDYTYDTLDRLLSITGHIAEEDTVNTDIFTYDVVGNRIMMTNNSPSAIFNQELNEGLGNVTWEEGNQVSYNFNNLNQIIGLCHSDTIDITNPESVATNEACANKDHFVNYYKYDRLGNLKEDDSQRYYYDYRNRLIKVTKLNGDEIANFTYDALGHRLTKQTANGTLKYAYSQNNLILETQYDENGTKVQTKEFVYSNQMDDVLAVFITEEKTNNGNNSNSNNGSNNGNGNNTKTTLYYYIKNHLGTPIALYDDKGKIVEEYETDEFGIVSTGKNSKLNNIFFTGKIYDKEIGLYYYNFRYYNPELGRFINRDPIGIVDDINLYVYVGNNPLKWTDPWGLAACGDVKRLLMDKAWNIARENVSSKIDVGVGASLNLVLGLGYGYEFLADNGLGVSAQMLKTFMYGDGSFQQYGKGDLIYDKVKNSKVYQEQLNMALIEIRKEGRYYNYGSNSFYSSSDRDLIYSIGLFDWEMGGRLNSNGLIETEFIMNDTYDFKINDYSSIVGGTLNNMGYWYQERNLGTIYEWELRISEIIK